MGILLSRRIDQILPVYAADISEICSALYELGGMAVVYDASGCNSTCTTHDKPRWYSMDSMMYISALSELETVMGNGERLVRGIVGATLNLYPAFIYIRETPIPMVMGIDFKGAARMIENKTGIPTFGTATNGMHSYVRGAGEALRWIVERFCSSGIKADRPVALKVNILEITPLDFSLTRDTARLKGFLRSHGMETMGCWAMESGLDELRLTSLADINLVVSAVGLPAATELKKMCRTPWVVGTPVGKRTSGRLTECIRRAVRIGGNRSLFDGAGYVASWDAGACVRPGLGLVDLPEDLSGRKVLIIGKQVMADSLRCCLREERDTDQVTVFCLTEGEKTLTLGGDIIDWDEDEVIRTIAESTVVVANPLYRQMCPAHRNIVFVDFPHEAYSGRMYHSIMRPFVYAPGDSV